MIKIYGLNLIKRNCGLNLFQPASALNHLFLANQRKVFPSCRFNQVLDPQIKDCTAHTLHKEVECVMVLRNRCHKLRMLAVHLLTCSVASFFVGECKLHPRGRNRSLLHDRDPPLYIYLL